MEIPPLMPKVGFTLQKAYLLLLLADKGYQNRKLEELHQTWSDGRSLLSV